VTRGVVQILAHPFSGSTLLTYLLGEHPQVMAVGELVWRHCYYRTAKDHPVLNREHLGPSTDAGHDGTFCIRCKDDCPIWGGIIQEPIPTEQLYSTIQSKQCVPWLVDSSKVAWWYMEMAQAQPQQHYLGVVLHKPVWAWVGSKARYSEYFHVLEYQHKKIMDWNKIPDHVIRDWALAWVSNIEAIRTEVECIFADFINLKYEDICRDHAGVTRLIWRRMGLTVPDDKPTCKGEDWAMQHQLHGNTGTNQRAAAAARRNGRVGIIMDDMVDTRKLPDPRFLEIPAAMPNVRRAMKFVGRTWP